MGAPVSPMRTALPVAVHLGLQVPFSYTRYMYMYFITVKVYMYMYFIPVKVVIYAGGKECVFWSQTICVVINYVTYHTKVLLFDNTCMRRGILSGFKPTA